MNHGCSPKSIYLNKDPFQTTARPLHCALTSGELLNGYKHEAFQWLHYVRQPIGGRRAVVVLETGPDGTDCVDELLISLSFTKTERNFRSGSGERKQTAVSQWKGRGDRSPFLAIMFPGVSSALGLQSYLEA